MNTFSHVIIEMRFDMKKIILYILTIFSFTFIIIDHIMQDGKEIITFAAEDLLPSLSHESGFYNESFELIITPKPNTTIYYTLDSSMPNQESMVYQNPILIESQYITADGSEVLIQNQIPPHQVYPEPYYPISMIRTGSDKWKTPKEDIFKATVLKYIVFDQLGNSSEVITHTYFVDDEMEDKYSFPIMSISTDIYNLYGYDTGINVPGLFYDPTIEEVSNQNRTGNYFQTGTEWEKPIFIEMFDQSGNRIIAQEAGIRTHGGLSRKYPVKSYRIYARSEYDTENYFDYQFFDESEINQFKRFILRGGGQAYQYSFMGEAAAQSLLHELDLEMQYSQPVILFLNGEYFGIRNIRDRLDDWYLQIKYDIPREDVTILQGHGSLAEGNPLGASHYLSMYRYATTNNMANQKNYEYVETLMDMDNFIDYYAAQIYFANVDWPQNNIEYWRYNIRYDKTKGAGQDGRWRWMVFDVDAGFNATASFNSSYDFNAFERLIGDSWKTGKLFTSLLDNQEFRTKFIRRMLDLMNREFSSEFATSKVQSFIDLYEPEMQEHIDRFSYPNSYDSWMYYVNRMYDFAEKRPEFLTEHLRSYFDLGENYNLLVQNDDSMSTIKVNTIDITSSLSEPWVGSYMKGVKLELKAQPKEGFRLVGWYNEFDELLSNDLTYEIEPEDDYLIKALFEVGTQIYPGEEKEDESLLFIIAISSITGVIGTALLIDYLRKRKMI